MAIARTGLSPPATRRTSAAADHLRFGTERLREVDDFQRTGIELFDQLDEEVVVMTLDNARWAMGVGAADARHVRATATPAGVARRRQRVRR